MKCRTAVAAMALAVAAAAGAQDASAATIQVPAIGGNTDGQNWYVNEKRFDGAYSLAATFGENPFGPEALNIRTSSGNDKAALSTDRFAGSQLSAVDGLVYRTLRSSFSVGQEKRQLPAINIGIDKNGGTLQAGDYTNLVFEPVYQRNKADSGPASIYEDAWQRWDAFRGGNAIWWSSNPIPAAPNRDTFVPLKTISDANPDATVLSLTINQGSGNPGLTAAVDGLEFSTAGASTVFDFGPTARTAPTVETVRAIAASSDGTNWFNGDTRLAGAASIGTGPADNLFGAQALNLTTPGGSDKVQAFTARYANSPIADITSMGYRSYRDSLSSAATPQLPAFNIAIDKNGGELLAGDFSTLVFEPVYQRNQADTGVATLAQDAWQGWDALRSGNAIWWSSNPIPGLPNRDTFVKWSDVVAANPSATILAVGINQGSGNGGLISAVDGVRFGLGNATPTTFDFDTTPAPTPDPTPTPTETPAPTTPDGTQPGASTPGQTPTPTTPVTPPSGGVAGDVATGGCKSSRRFTIRVRAPKRLGAIRKVTVRVSGKRVKVKRASARRATAKIDLRGLPAKKVTVSIRIVGRNGKVSKQTRRYVTCKKGS